MFNRRITAVFCVLVIVVLAISVNAQNKKNLTVETLLDWRYAGSAEINPDGSKIAYTYRWNDKIEDRSYTNIWIVTSDGVKNRPLTQGKFNDSSPEWSPDGTRIAYVSNRSGKRQIHVRWLDTGDDAVVTDVLQGPGSIRWSPDGEYIAFTMFVPGKPEPGVKMPFKPRGAKWADPPIVVTKLRWRRDGGGYVRNGTTHIFVVPATGGAARQITDGEYSDGGIEWTPDGKSILTTGNHRPDSDYTLDGGEIFAVDVETGEYRQLTSRKGPDNGPIPSPDGKYIAYTGYDFTGWSYTVSKMYVMDADGSNPRMLTGKLDRDARGPVWSPDGKGIYFPVQDRGETQIYYTDLNGNYRQVTHGSHQVQGFSIARNGQVAALLSGPVEPGDVYTFSTSNPDMKQLTFVNDNLLAGYELGGFEEIWYKAFDGRDIQGWIITPPGFDPGKKYPLVLYIHGGPHSMYGIRFNHTFQTLAGAGYVVLFTNPRGSTGYGQEFGGLIWRAYPKDDFHDLMNGVDEVIKRGYIDESKLCVTGGSGGGCLTAWIIGHTDRFAAAVSQYPVTNWITQIGTADAGYYHGKMWMDGMPWENPQFYIERSPVFYAGNFTTPTMVLTGEEDFRTPMAESEELYLALKTMRVDTKLIRVPGEPHGASRNHPSHAIAKVLFILDWFEKYINE